MSRAAIWLLLACLLGTQGVRAQESDLEARQAFRMQRDAKTHGAAADTSPRLVHVLSRGHVLRPAHFGEGGAAARTVPATFFGLRAKRTLGRGSVVRLQDLEPIPLVRRNEEVTAFVREGSLLITLRAVARDDAGLHQTVRMRNKKTNKLIEGVVVGRGQVQVELTKTEALP